MAPKNQATQNFVPIKEVRDGIIILEDGSMRAILMASSINFALKSSDEQEAVIYQFQNFLNSLDFPIQISTQSRRLDIRPYVNLLESRQKEQTDDLLKIQIREYIEFIKTFTDNVEIMTKNFYIVVPYNPPGIDISKAKLPFGKKEDKKTDVESFEERRMQIDQRMAVVEQGLSRSGIRTVQLGTEEVIEVFYKVFNPGDVEKSLDLDLTKIQ
jgi:type IV secretory pathway VirB4 component